MYFSGTLEARVEGVPYLLQIVEMSNHLEGISFYAFFPQGLGHQVVIHHGEVRLPVGRPLPLESRVTGISTIESRPAAVVCLQLAPAAKDVYQAFGPYHAGLCRSALLS